MHGTPHLVSYLRRADVNVVIERVPLELRARLREVFLSYRHRGVRWLGSVVTRGRRDVNLFSTLPSRVSLRRFIYPGQSAREFGAPARGQWPPWAVRRFLLYDVLLHEIGHLQPVRNESRSWRRRFADETLAQRFADTLRRDLWSQPFDHADPVHHPPSAGEIDTLEVWQRLDKERRHELVMLALAAPHDGLPCLERFRPLSTAQRKFLRWALCHVRATESRSDCCSEI